MIKNKKDLSTTPLRRDVIAILEAGLAAVDPAELMSQVKYRQDFNSVEIHEKTYYLFKGRIFVVGGGKAAGPMAEGLEAVLGAENITAGIVNAPRDDYNTKIIEINKAGHPLPDKKGIRGVETMLELKEKYDLTEKDLVVCLFSGGGSAMLPAPVSGISLDDLQETTEVLLKSGASIQEINSVRKHLSRIKGGQLARHFAPAQVAAIIVSDVGDCDTSVIASGPAAPDRTTFQDAWLVLEKYHLRERLPASVIRYLEQGLRGQAPETPKELSQADNYVIGTPAGALEAMSLKARQLGFKPIIVTTDLRGSSDAAAQAVAGRIKEREFLNYDCLLFGGETTPTLPSGHGKGGRNMHYAAATMLALESLERKWSMASLASDGRDYVPGVGGALVDDNSINQAAGLKLDTEKYLKNYDSYELLDKLENSLIRAVDTGTNVCDVMVYLFR